jgi:hypothetical protein
VVSHWVGLEALGIKASVSFMPLSAALSSRTILTLKF